VQPSQQGVGRLRRLLGGGLSRLGTGPAAAARGAAGEDPADRVGAEAGMLNRAPAVDFPGHRSEFGVGAVRPVAQRLHRANGEAGTAVDDNWPRVVAVGAGVAWTEFGRQQQQGAVAQAGGIARAADGHADQRGRLLGWRPPRRGAEGFGAGGQERCHHTGIGR